MTPGSEGRGETRGPATAREAALAFIPPPDGDPALAAALRRAQPGEPARVDRLDRHGGGYYLVPFYAEEALRAIVEVDAESGEIRKAGAIRGADVPFLLTPEEALEAVRAHAPDLLELGEPHLGWRPCRESFDSALPFWVIEHAEGRVYVGQTGVIHEKLSTAGLGGGGA